MLPKAGDLHNVCGGPWWPSRIQVGSLFTMSGLAAVVGSQPLPRTEVTKKIWEYIRKHKLQDPDDKRSIRADDKLKPIFGGKASVSMFEMTKLVNAHLK